MLPPALSLNCMGNSFFVKFWRALRRSLSQFSALVNLVRGLCLGRYLFSLLSDTLRDKQQQLTRIRTELDGHRFSHIFLHVSCNLILRPMILFWNQALIRHSQPKRRKDKIMAASFQYQVKGITLMMDKVTASRMAYTIQKKLQLPSPLLTLFFSEPLICVWPT